MKKKYGLFKINGWEHRFSPRERKFARRKIHRIYKSLTISNPKLGIKSWF